MLVKLGVDISRLNRPIRRALEAIERIFNLYNLEAVITSTYEGDHMVSSLHYANDAIGIRKPPHSETLILESIRRDLGKDFDVVMETDHYHIEYDPKKKKPLQRGTV